MPTLANELDAVGLRVGGSSFRRGTVACTGTEFCRLAITETKNFSRWLVDELEERLPGFDHHLKLHVTGCPNSCGQHWISDIGIEGKKIKVDEQLSMPTTSASVGPSGSIRLRHVPSAIAAPPPTCLMLLSGCWAATLRIASRVKTYGVSLRVTATHSSRVPRWRNDSGCSSRSSTKFGARGRG